MNFEKSPIETTRKNLYPERASANLDPRIKRIKELESGAANKIELNDEEKSKLFEFENGLGSELEKIYFIKISSCTFYPEYFQTEEGKNNLESIIGKELKGLSINEIRKELYRNRKTLKEKPLKILTDLGGKSTNFVDDKLLSLLSGTIDKNGEIDIENTDIPERVKIILNPENALEKISQLRNFKKKLKDEIEKIKIQETYSENFKKSMMGILEIYAKRINEMIADNYGIAVAIKEMSKEIGIDSASNDEKGIMNLNKGLKDPEANYARLDKFNQGASKEYDENGMRRQIGDEMQEYADQIEKEYISNEVEKDRLIKEKGLDPKKIAEENIDTEQFSKWEEEELEHYEVKSSQPQEEYDPARIGLAPDGKWQFIARAKFKSMSVDSKQRIVKSGIESKNIEETIATLLGHETEGHMIQALNKSKIKLKLFEEVGSDRISIFSEGGAMMVEDYITQNAFGFRTIPHPHYIKAMIKKSEGGNYLDCVKAFYDSALKVMQEKKKNGIINDEQLVAEARNNIKLAINRAKRLFADNAKFESNAPSLTRSRDSVYLEQSLLLEKLKEAGMEKYAFIGKVNLDSLIKLTEIGLVNLNEIKSPDYYSLKIWDRIKDNYRL